jgi:hypothetical protein
VADSKAPVCSSRPLLPCSQTTSDRCAILLKLVIQGLAVIVPAHLSPALDEMRSVAAALADRAAAGLRVLAAADLSAGGAAMDSGVAVVGRLMQRELSCMWENVRQMVVQHAERGGAPEVRAAAAAAGANGRCRPLLARCLAAC